MNYESNRASGLLDLRVSQVLPLTPYISVFELKHPDGAPLPGYLAGAHIKVQVEIDGKPGWRHYSLINTDAHADTSDQPPAYLIAVRREDTEAGGRGGSLYLHSQVKVGHTLQVSHPINGFSLDPAHDDVVLIAGGIGVTPLISMATALQAAGKRYTIHYSGRSYEQMALVPELKRVAAGALALYAADDPEHTLDLRKLLTSCHRSQALYTCGPKGMISAVADIARELGWPNELIKYELFAEATTEAGDQEFELKLAQSSISLRVPADKTILDVMLDAGLDPMFDCKRGDCGVCMVGVLEGEVEHRDNCLTPSEKAAGNVIQICISRAKGQRLVLDA